MKIFTKMAAVVLACMLAVPGEARVNVVYQQQDSLRIVGLLQQIADQQWNGKAYDMFRNAAFRHQLCFLCKEFHFFTTSKFL